MMATWPNPDIAIPSSLKAGRKLQDRTAMKNLTYSLVLGAPILINCIMGWEYPNKGGVDTFKYY